MARSGFHVEDIGLSAILRVAAATSAWLLEDQVRTNVNQVKSDKPTEIWLGWVILREFDVLLKRARLGVQERKAED